MARYAGSESTLCFGVPNPGRPPEICVTPDAACDSWEILGPESPDRVEALDSLRTVQFRAVGCPAAGETICFKESDVQLPESQRITQFVFTPVSYTHLRAH